MFCPALLGARRAGHALRGYRVPAAVQAAVSPPSEPNVKFCLWQDESARRGVKRALHTRFARTKRVEHHILYVSPPRHSCGTLEQLQGRREESHIW